MEQSLSLVQRTRLLKLLLNRIKFSTTSWRVKS